MKMIKCIAFQLFVLCLASCTTIRATGLPDNYSGPRAELVDTIVYPESGGKLMIFAAESVDGRPISNAKLETWSASRGQRSTVLPMGKRREVPAQRLRVRLVGSHITAMPIQEIASRMAGTFFEVTGEVDFEPTPGKSYRVMGELAAGGSSVWIESEDDSQVVTEKVRSSR